MAEITEKRFPRIVFTDSQDNSDIGGGSSSVANVSITYNAETPFQLCVVYEGEATTIINVNESGTYKVPVFKNAPYVFVYSPSTYTITDVEGNAEIVDGPDSNKVLVIGGDCYFAIESIIT